MPAIKPYLSPNFGMLGVLWWWRRGVLLCSTAADARWLECQYEAGAHHLQVLSWRRDSRPHSTTAAGL